MAIVNTEYKFIYADAGQPDRTSDGGVFARTQFYEILIRKELQIPNETPLTATEIKTPHVIVADDDFCLSENQVKPYLGLQSKGSPQKVFNYRLCRPKRVVENVFGQLATVFHVFCESINLGCINSVVSASTHLHTYLR
jgi:hypothetical protein